MRPLALLLCFAFMSTSAQALCRGKNLLENQPAKTLAALEAVAKKHPYSEGIYFRARKNGKDTYLFGTAHYSDPKTKFIPKLIKARIKNASVVYTEITDAEAYKYYQAIQKEVKAKLESVVIKDNTGIKKHFTDQEWKQILQVLRENNIPIRRAEHIKPWAISNLVNQDTCDTSGGNFLDSNITKYAQRGQIPVKGLETHQELLKLDRSQTRSEAIKAAKYGLFFREHMPSIQTTFIDLYLQERIFMISEFGYAFQRSKIPRTEVRNSAREFKKSILTDRNKSWMKHIIPATRKGDAFIAVGALHLGGSTGLLRLLERRGYKITRLSVK